MSRPSYIAAVAVLLLIISSWGGMAEATSGETGAPGAAAQSGAHPSQRPEGYASDPGYMGRGVSGQGGAFGPSERRSFGFDQPATTSERGPGGTGETRTPPRLAAAGEGTVIDVDQPDNCLRIREGPTTASRQIGCARMGERLPLSGNFSRDNRWAQLTDTGWVFVCQIRTNLRPPGGPVACRRGGLPYGTVYEGMDWGGPAGYYGADFLGPRYFYGGYGPHWWGRPWHHHHWRHKGHKHHGHHWKHGGGKK
jgi:hypothetical protein